MRDVSMFRLPIPILAFAIVAPGCTIEPLCEPADFLTACPANMDPVADAGPDQTVPPGDFVVLDGSASTDDDVITCCAEPDDLIIRMGGEVRTYRWEQVAGDPVNLEAPDSVSPSFTAPAAPGDRVFDLTVTDDRGGTNTDRVTISISVPGAGDMQNAGNGDNETESGG